MFIKISKYSWVLILLCFGFLSCAKPVPKTALSPEKNLEVERLLQELRSSSSFDSLSSLVQVSVEARGRREFFDAALLLQAPNRLRIEILDDLGQTLSRLIADGSQVQWYDAKEDGYVLLPQDGEALKKLLRLPITIEEFISRLLLRFPEAAILQATPRSEATPGWKILREDDQIMLRLRPLGLEVFQKNKGANSKKFLYQVDYAVDQTPSKYPPELRWSFRQPKVLLTLRMNEPRLNLPIAAEKFVTDPPPGARLGKIH